MDLQTVMERRVAALSPTLDAALSDDLREFVDVGEPGVALVTMIENAPELVDEVFLAEVVRHYAGSGDYNEPFALDAVAKWRRWSTSS